MKKWAIGIVLLVVAGLVAWLAVAKQRMQRRADALQEMRDLRIRAILGPRMQERPDAEVSLALTASPSNCVEVSVGVDANEDGVLDLDEADWTFGYNCGTWFCRDARTDDFACGWRGSRPLDFVRI